LLIDRNKKICSWTLGFMHCYYYYYCSHIFIIVVVVIFMGVVAITTLFIIIIVIIYYCPRGDRLYSMHENATIVPLIHTTVRARRWKKRCYYNTEYTLSYCSLWRVCVSVWTHCYNVVDFANTLLYYCCIIYERAVDLLATVFEKIIVSIPRNRCIDQYI